MSDAIDRKTADFYRGVRASIRFLHELAREMNDPHARAVLNSAAFDLGVNKPAAIDKALETNPNTGREG